MKHIYTTTDILAGGIRVSVRQVLGSGDRQVPEKIRAAAVSAQHWLNLAIADRGSIPHKNLFPAVFRFCFHADPIPQKTNIVFSVLHTIQSALSRPFGVKVLKMEGGTLGYVKKYYSGCVQQVGGAYQFDSDGDVIHRRGEIHIMKNLLGEGDITAVTLIHEAGHKYANLRDHGWAGYFKSDYAGYEENRLTWQQCMVNADSYAVFVYLMANPQLANRRVPGLVRAAMRSNAVDDYSGLESLFG